MSENVISSYLVSLGYNEQPESTNKLKTFLQRGERMAEFSVTSLAGSVLKFQGAALSGYAAIGLGALDMVKHAAEADQQFRLLGERTFQTTQNARKFAAIQDILGANLNQIAFDPELLAREKALSKSLDQISAGMGGNYEQRMKDVRDVDVQLKLLKYEFLTLIPDAVSKSLNAVFGGSESLTQRLTTLTSYFAANFSHISDNIAKYLTPVIKDAKNSLISMVPAVTEVASAIIGLIGTLSNDDKLKGGKVSFENIARAASDTSRIIAGFVKSISSAITVTLDLASAVVDLARAAYDLAHLDFKGVAKDMAAAGGQIATAGGALTHGGGAVVGGIGGAAAGSAGGGAIGSLLGGALGSMLGPAGTLAGVGIGGSIGATVGGAGGMLGGGLLGSLFGHGDSSAGDQMSYSKLSGILGGIVPKPTFTPSQAGKALMASGIDYDGIAKRTGIPPELLKGIILSESSGNRNVKDSPTGAIGIAQVEPYNAHGLNLRDPSQNVTAAAMLLKADFDKLNGDIPATIAAYNGGLGRVHQVLRDGKNEFKPETSNYIPTVMGNMQSARQAAPQQNIQITVTSNASDPHQVASAVMDQVKRKANAQMLASMNDASGVYNY
jgi:hypothetical protein